MPGDHLLDRYSLTYDSEAYCDDCHVVIDPRLQDRHPTVGDLTRACLAHEIEHHPAQARGNNG